MYLDINSKIDFFEKCCIIDELEQGIIKDYCNCEDNELNIISSDQYCKRMKGEPRGEFLFSPFLF